MSYGLSVKLLQEVLPIEGEINASSIRNNGVWVASVSKVPLRAVPIKPSEI